MRSIKILILIIALTNYGFSQNTEIGINYILSTEGLVSSDETQIFENSIAHSFGMNGRKIIKSDFFILGEVNFKNFGAKLKVEERTIQNPEGTGDFFYVNWKAQGLEIPISFGYYILNQKKIRIGTSIGISNLFLFNQKQELKGQNSDAEIYEKYLISFKSCLEIGVKISNNLVLNIIPFWQRQLNSNSSNLSNHKQRGIGCKFGISYNFKEK